MFIVLFLFLAGFALLWALCRNSGIVNSGISVWYARHVRTIWLCVILFAAAYLAVHFMLFDQYIRITGVWDFIKQGTGHFWHVAPLLAIFGYFFVLEGTNRWKKRSKR